LFKSRRKENQKFPFRKIYHRKKLKIMVGGGAQQLDPQVIPPDDWASEDMWLPQASRWWWGGGKE
jgi:hypothetical protein